MNIAVLGQIVGFYFELGTICGIITIWVIIAEYGIKEMFKNIAFYSLVIIFFIILWLPFVWYVIKEEGKKKI